eukprot:5520722-Pyramimonas_sp.AAC.1
MRMRSRRRQRNNKNPILGYAEQRSSDTRAIYSIVKHSEHAGFTSTVVVQTYNEASIKVVARCST